MTDYDIEQFFAEEAWALRCGFETAQQYWDATREAFDSEQAGRDQWEASE